MTIEDYWGFYTFAMMIVTVIHTHSYYKGQNSPAWAVGSFCCFLVGLTGGV